MRSRAALGVLILASASLGGCIGAGGTEDESRFIDDESELARITAVTSMGTGSQIAH